MRAISRLVLVAALFIGLVPATLSAQAWKADVGINGGASWYSESLDDEVAGPEGARFKAGWLLGSQISYWMSEKIGIRANFTYSERPLKADGDVSGLLNENELYGHVNLWSGSGDLLFRLRTPNPRWEGAETLPFIALGIGGKWVNPANDYETCVDSQENKSWDCATVFPSTGPVALGEQKVIMGLVGLGADFRLSPRSALRLEISDRIYKPQAYNATPTATFADGKRIINLPQGDELVSSLTHEIGAQLGFHLLMGLAPEPVIAVVPPPRPTPPAAPTPAPPAPPVENAITVCVIDPTQPSGIRMQNALYRVEQRDTVVMQGGNRVPLSQVAGNAMIARDAGWFVRGEPLTMTIGNRSVQYLTYQGAMQIDPNRVSYLGTINGYPIYADRDEVADVISALNTARAANPNRDLGAVLAERRDLRDALEDVAFLYVPLQRTNCVFQPLQMMQQVIKGK